MPSYWDILIGLAALELILASILFIMVLKIASKPVGARLVLLASIFIVQTIAGIIIYDRWRNMGYGPEISQPLLLIQSMIILGTIVLIDITKG